MKKDIISQKIRKEVCKLPIDDEPRVMYLMVEIRKVLEHEKDRESILRFYSDWVVHTKLDGFAARTILGKIENCTIKLGREAYDIIRFSKLKSEMKLFLKKYNLPNDLITNNNYWKSFCYSLMEILIDTPIEKKDNIITISFSYRKSLGGIAFHIKDHHGVDHLKNLLDPW